MRGTPDGEYLITKIEFVVLGGMVYCVGCDVPFEKLHKATFEKVADALV